MRKTLWIGRRRRTLLSPPPLGTRWIWGGYAAWACYGLFVTIPPDETRELLADLRQALEDFASRDPLVRLSGCAEVLDVLRRTQDLLEEAVNAGRTTH